MNGATANQAHLEINLLLRRSTTKHENEVIFKVKRVKKRP
jgi:hypothetical protein